MIFNIITIFPEILDSYINESIIKRAIEKKIIKIKMHNLRKWTKDKHKTVDDTPYGGGAGMLLKIEPIYKALKKIHPKKTNKKRKIILLSAGGKKWDQKTAKKYSKIDEITFICGRYEGVDERVKNFIDEEISIGDYVLTGGELPAMVMIDSITRLLPGVLGNKKSLNEESHEKAGMVEYPQYTKPAIFKYKKNKKTYKLKTPNILLSGNHEAIKKWKDENKKPN
jgi:tRNA (guanine37-N1)-methyltransferase